MRQRVLQQGQQLRHIQPAQEQLGHLPQEPARRGQAQRAARAVIRGNPPDLQRRRHPACQVAIRGDKRGALAACGRVEQAMRDGRCLCAG